MPSALRLGQGNAGLPHVFAFAVFVGGFAYFVALEEEHLSHAFASVDFGGQGGSVGKFQRYIAFPFRLERGHVHDDAAARIGGFAQTHGEHVARDAEIFHRACQREGVGRDDAAVVFHGNEVFRIEVFRIDDGAVDVGEDFEFVGAADVVAVAGGAVGNNAAAVLLFDLVRLERLDHAMLFGHAADPAVGFDAHGVCPGVSWFGGGYLKNGYLILPAA